MASAYVLKQVNPVRYAAIVQGYADFLAAVNDPTTEPVNFLLPLDEKKLAELELVREISRELLKIKEEDIRKAAEAAQQAEENEEKSEEVEEKPASEEIQQEEEKEQEKEE